jgi:glycosyltransferase involved in cell wall biosynthesis
VFVSTPDLLDDVPSASWLPVVVDVDEWKVDTAVLERETPVVVHAPSRASIKGTDLIEPVMRALEEDGLVEYRRIEGIPHDSMPAAYADADIVLDQFRLGGYGVAAVEAMASGRLVVSHVGEQSREVVAAVTGLELPIVQSRASDLDQVIRDILADRPKHRAVAARGLAFANGVHDGRRSAQALAGFLS